VGRSFSTLQSYAARECFPLALTTRMKHIQPDSELLLNLYRQAWTMPVAEFHEWAIRLTRPVLRFQSACWGVGHFEGHSIDSTLVPLTVRTLEIDPQSTSDWISINRADKVIPIALAAQDATCNFHAPTLFSGRDDSVMRDYAHRYGRQCYLITVMRGEPGSIVEWLSLYRPDPDDHYSEDERAQCQLLTHHLGEASKINRFIQSIDPDFLKSLDDANDLSFLARETESPGSSGTAADRAQRTARAHQASEFVKRYRITPAEWRVARHLIEGWTAVQIADALNISLATVRSHISALLAKSGTNRQAQFVAKWLAEQRV
jgi:DNA-binding CsgD family transcriptional regulator